MGSHSCDSLMLFSLYRSIMKKPKLEDWILWKGELAKIIATADKPTVTIQMHKNPCCKECGADLGKYKFSVIPTSPLFQENAEPLQTLNTEE